jgi:hypothetical protein
MYSKTLSQGYDFHPSGCVQCTVILVSLLKAYDRPQELTMPIKSTWLDRHVVNKTVIMSDTHVRLTGAEGRYSNCHDQWHQIFGALLFGRMGRHSRLLLLSAILFSTCSHPLENGIPVEAHHCRLAFLATSSQQC